MCLVGAAAELGGRIGECGVRSGFLGCCCCGLGVAGHLGRPKGLPWVGHYGWTGHKPREWRSGSLSESRGRSL
jgi:hypothetical protein